MRFSRAWNAQTALGEDSQYSDSDYRLDTRMDTAPDLSVNFKESNKHR